MSVTSVSLVNLSGNTSGAGAGTPQISYTETYQLKTSGGETCRSIFAFLETTSLSVDNSGAAVQVPFFGRIGPNGLAYQDLDVQYIKNSEGMWTLTAKCNNNVDQNKPKDDKDGKKTDDPRDWHDEIECGSTKISVPVSKALYIGQAANKFLVPGQVQSVCNSAGEPFDPLPEKEIDIATIRITKYGESWNEADASQFRNLVNSDFVFIDKLDYKFQARIAPFCGRIVDYSGRYGIENGIKYWLYSIEVWIHPEDWRLEILDAGTMAYIPTLSAGGARLPPQATDEPQRMKDDHDYPITNPMPLDGQGFRATKGQPPVYLTYSTYREGPFAGIKW